MTTSTLSVGEKEAYLRPIFNNYLALQCRNKGLRAPLEVWKRASGEKGVYGVYFAKDSHMRYFCDKYFGTAMDADTSALTEHWFGDLGASDVKVRVTGAHSEPMRMTFEFPSYCALVNRLYTEAQVMDAQIKQEEAASVPVQPMMLVAQGNNNFMAEALRHNDNMNPIYSAQMTAHNQMMGFEPTH